MSTIFLAYILLLLIKPSQPAPSTSFSASGPLIKASSQRNFFEQLGESPDFREKVWQRKPCLMKKAMRVEEETSFTLKVRGGGGGRGAGRVERLAKRRLHCVIILFLVLSNPSYLLLLFFLFPCCFFTDPLRRLPNIRSGTSNGERRCRR